MVYPQGLAGEVVVDGTHEVPTEVMGLWIKCQEIKSQRRHAAAGHPRGPNRGRCRQRSLFPGRMDQRASTVIGSPDVFDVNRRFVLPLFDSP